MSTEPDSELKVDKDWGSTSLWILEHGKWLNTGYEDFNLPDWLIRRLDYWSAWYESHAPWNGEVLDNDSFEAYGLSLAIDLKLFLGARYRVYFRGRITKPIPFDPHNVPPR